MIGDKVRSLRKSLGYTQQQLADKLNVSRSTIKMIETGINKPSFDLLERMANFFNVSADYFLNDDINDIINNNREVKPIPTEEKRKEVKGFVAELLKRCVMEGIIKDPNNIDEETQEAIWAAVKLEIKRIKKQQEHQS